MKKSGSLMTNKKRCRYQAGRRDKSAKIEAGASLGKIGDLEAQSCNLT